MHALLLTLLIAQTPLEAPDVVVVVPQAFLTALDPWIQHRTDQGHRLAFVSNLLSAEEIRGEIRETARGGALKFILLVGDAEPTADTQPAVRARSVPTHLADAKVNVHWGSEPQIATDNWYADLNDDQLPDVAIGRLTADSPAELSRMVEKILAYERTLDYGLWRQRINFVAGVGGFGPLIDPLLEMATTKFLTEGIPSAFDTTMTYGSWRSPYCPDPRKFHEHTIDRLNEGCLFWVYIGHGQRTFLDRVQTPASQHHILAAGDVSKLNRQHTPPIAIFLACYTGAFDAPRDCLAEEMLRADGGPVAVFSGSRVTMPYAMAVMGTAMMDEFFQSRRPTLGEVILHAKRRMATDAIDDQRPGTDANAILATEEEDRKLGQRQLLDSLAQALSPAPGMLAAERLEHVALFNLLGDPLLRVQHPGEVTVTTQSTIAAGETLMLNCHAPLAGTCVIELVCRRDRMRLPAPSRAVFQPLSAWLETFDDVYHQANDRRWFVHQVNTEAGEFQIELPIPSEARGPCNVRIFMTGEKSFAVGAADVFVRRPK